MMRRVYQWCCGLCFLVMATSLAAATTQAYQLHNGLRLLVREDHRSPVVVHQIWYRIGAVDEAWGHTGISHVLEHMMFKGTPQHPEGEFSRRISEVGGQQNAATGDDYTYYWQKIRPGLLAHVLQLEADRMQHLSFAQKAFDHELKVVKEERTLRVDDRPSGVLYERFSAIANTPGPYAHGAIGWLADLNHMRLDDVNNWYQRWYVPNNATIVVVGDVQAEQVHRDVLKYFAAIPSRAVPVSHVDQDQRPWGTRHIDVTTNTKLPMVMLGYAVPSLNTKRDDQDAWALFLLASALGHGDDSGRLAKHLVRGKTMLSSAYAYYDVLQRGQTQFVLSAVPTPGRHVDEVVVALQAQISDLQQHLLPDDELQKLKQQASASYIFDQDSLVEQASTLGQLAAVGLPPTLAERWVEHVNAVTAEQLQQVAKRYLQADRLTIAVTQPKKSVVAK